MKTLTLSVTLLLLLAVSASAASSGLLRERHHLELQVGVWNNNHEPGIDATIVTPELNLEANGLTGSLRYGYSLTEAVAVGVSVGVRSVEAKAIADHTRARLDAVTVAHILFGLRYHWPRSTYGSKLRPYLMADIGPYIGHEAWVQGWNDPSVGAGSESAIGARLGGGVNVLVGSRTTLGVSLGYHLMSDFDRPVGGLRNYSGPQFAIGLGYLFGRR